MVLILVEAHMRKYNYCNKNNKSRILPSSFFTLLNEEFNLLLIPLNTFFVSYSTSYM